MSITSHDLGETGPPRSIIAVKIVDFFRTINTDADKKVVLFEKTGPAVINQCAIGLQGIADGLPLGVYRCCRSTIF